MRSARAALGFGIALALSIPCLADQTVTVKETYDGGIAQALWRVSTRDQVLPDGGSPGAYLRTGLFDQAVPTAVYIGPVPPEPTPWLGNYRAMGVIGLGIDIKIFSVGIGDDNRDIALVLSSDMGTPDDPSDDCEAYTVTSKNLPKPGGDFRSFDVRVPADNTTLPQNWVVRGPCAGLTGDDAWNAVITNVTRVTFPFSDPDLFWFFQIWDIGIDNPRIVFKSGAPGT